MNELDRIRAEYARRAQDPDLRARYSLFRRGTLFMTQTRERAVLHMLQQAGLEPLDRFDILELGCGEGGVLLDLLRWGADPCRVHGCDLLTRDLGVARRRLPVGLGLAAADAGALPYPDAHFDLALQFTVLTSVLDDALRQRIAKEVWRVLRPGGALLSYDFRFRGGNRAVRAIHPVEVKTLFPEARFVARRATLAPPISRWLAPRSWPACEVFAFIPWLRTHDLILAQKMER